ncbi:hypothetical protein [Streptomyces sp. KAU_LT]|uniref:hypothetical protein n=1 Tax=Streptomyces sp. KAU_LT TaxID=3046669 RepID=UPI0024B68144|nr:hypothetical protein [Streptomyces sp. KAU_LT]MDI9836315.1 hypothetical protein [Streptomyces sp. KAU_LT]
MNTSPWLRRDFVGGVLDQFEELAVAISALGDTTLPVGVFGHEAGVHGVGLENAGRLFENGLDYI